METYTVWGVQIQVDNVIFNDEGEIENWDLYIGGQEIICGCDFLDDLVIKELEEKIISKRKSDYKND